MSDESQEMPGQEPAAAAIPSDVTPTETPSEANGASAAEELAAAPENTVRPTDIVDEEPAVSEEPVDEEPAVEEPVAAAKTADSNGAASAEPAEEIKKDWYILKVQSNREDTIAEGLHRRVAIAGLQDYFGEIIVPTEMVTEFKNGKKKIVKRKLYPGYIVIHMAITEDTWFLVRDTPGIGDFTGAGGKPIPMLPHEVSKLIAKQEEKTEEAPRLKISFKVGDRVKINEGTFENFEGDVENIDEQNGRVTVMINIFGRSTPVELEYWQVESI